MAIWTHPLRLGLALIVVGVSAAVVLNMRERAEPVQAVVVQRTDPDAIIETRGSEIVQADGFGDNIRVVAAHQMTYAGGGLRMTDGVEVTIAAREDRDGFVLRSTTATVDADKTELSLGGSVRLTAGGDLEATTESAQYTDAEGVVRMPGPAAFVRGEMEASAASSVYDRAADLLQLSSRAAVALAAAGETPTTIIADSATVAQADGYMAFEGGVSIEAGGLRMEAARAHADLIPDTSQIEALVLGDGAQITGSESGAGQLRTMSATDIELAYSEDGEGVERAALTGGARMALMGSTSDRGAEIAAASMEIAFDAEGSGIRSLLASDDVALELPAADSAAGQRIVADTLDVDGLSGGGSERARFTGGVEYREQTAADRGARVGRAELLEATLAGGLSALEAATFLGGVTFEDGDIIGRGDEARYLIAEDAVEFVTGEVGGQAPRVLYERGSVRADTLRIGFTGPQIGAQGGVESVLGGNAAEDGGAEYPGLVDVVDALLVTANTLSYDGAEQLVMYSGGAHLWQGDTTFRGDTLVLDEATGNLLIDGAVQTSFAMSRLNQETEEVETSLATGSAEAMRYEKDLHRVTYAGAARLDGPQGDLQADHIRVQLQPDDMTLDRVTATGSVTLLIPGRVVSGDRLVYHDAGGRYEVEGPPATFAEQVDEGCRETLGHTLTFFTTANDVSVDGQSQVRTATASVACPAQLLK